MSLTPSDLEKEKLKKRALEIFARASALLEDMRLFLEQGRPLDASECRDRLMPMLVELFALLDPDQALAAPRHAGTDQQSLQDFRRAALDDMESLRKRFSILCSGAWRSGADVSQAAAVRTASLRLTVWCVLALAALAGWWGWQQHRQATAKALLDKAKSETAAQGVKLISMAAWLAVKNQGRPLGELVKDMSGDCSGIDVDQTLPNHPCRQAWTEYRQTIFHASIPAPGAPVDCPSELFFDPWGGPYVLVVPVQGRAKVLSAGPDGLVGTPDDVTSDIPSWGNGG